MDAPTIETTEARIQQITTTLEGLHMAERTFGDRFPSLSAGRAEAALLRELAFQCELYRDMSDEHEEMISSSDI